MKALSATDTDRLIPFVEKLSQRRVSGVIRKGCGGNSRIFQVRCDGRPLALKFYRSSKTGPWSRLKTESEALKFFERHGINQTPRLMAVSEEENCSLLEWIDAQSFKGLTAQEMTAVTDFLKKLHALRTEKSAAEFPLGTEACLCLDDLIRQLRMRSKRLLNSSDRDVCAFLKTEFEPAVDTVAQWARRAGGDFSRPLDRSRQTLSPVDFGSHNMMKKDGMIFFLDFEYFGWADPVNLISDTLLHPGMDLDDDSKRFWFDKMMEIYGEDERVLDRVKIFYPLYGLRWCAIMLNCFLPGYVVCGSENLTREEKREVDNRQLKRVRRRLDGILSGYREFAYGRS